MQKILNISTSKPSLRADADSWSAEDGDVIRKDKVIGLSPGYKRFYCYPTVMHAIADGWKLLAPPVYMMDSEYIWWLVKD